MASASLAQYLSESSSSRSACPVSGAVYRVDWVKARLEISVSACT